MTATQTVAPGREFVISRVLDAPRDLVWKCFTDPEHMKQWWGPKGAKVLKSDMDLRVGGTYHYALQMEQWPAMWGKFVFREIVPQEKLVFVSGFSDERAASPATRWRRPGRWSCFLSSPSRTFRVARRSSPCVGCRTTRPPWSNRPSTKVMPA